MAPEATEDNVVQSAESNAAGTLSREDRDTIGEITNIAMGAASTTLGMLLSMDAEMGTPTVTEYPNLDGAPEPFSGEEKIAVLVQYTQGFNISTGYIFKLSDAHLMARLMLNEPTDGDATIPLSELELSSIGEAMSQMMSASATSMASVIHKPVEINTPEVIPFTADTLAITLPKLSSEAFTVITFDIKLSNNQIIPFWQYVVASEAKSQVTELLAVVPDNTSGIGKTDSDDPDALEDELVENLVKPTQQGSMNMNASPGQDQPAPSGAVQVNPVTVRPVEFGSFDNQQQIFGEENKNLSLVMDVSLSLTVELGKTQLSIKEVLELTRGSVIELDRVAGEPVDLLANGKLIAKGEVVVIEDNFGLRITSIVAPADRLRGV